MARRTDRIYVALRCQGDRNRIEVGDTLGHLGKLPRLIDLRSNANSPLFLLFFANVTCDVLNVHIRNIHRAKWSLTFLRGDVISGPSKLGKDTVTTSDSFKRPKAFVLWCQSRSGRKGKKILGEDWEKGRTSVKIGYVKSLRLCTLPK